MTLKAGDVVILKSGGQPLTVADVKDDMVSCVWIGEEGDLFRETLPLAVLDLLDLSDDEDEDEHDNAEDSDDEDQDEDEEDAHHGKKAEVA